MAQGPERETTGEITPGEYRGSPETPGAKVSRAAGGLTKALIGVWNPDVLETISGIERIKRIAGAIEGFKDVAIDYYAGTDQAEEVREMLGRGSNSPEGLERKLSPEVAQNIRRIPFEELI